MMLFSARQGGTALAAFALGLFLAAPVTAQTMEDLRPDFMQGCLANGETEADCACVFDGWSERVAPDDLDTARIAVRMYLGEPPSGAGDMMAAMRMMQGLAGVSVECAMRGAALPEGMAIPGMGSGDAGDGGDAGSGSAILQQMMELDARQQARDAERDAKEQRRREAEDQRIMDQTRELRAAYAVELERIHSRPIDAWTVSDFEPLFDLYCRSGGGDPTECACAWPILADLSTFNAIPYLASRSEGDDARQRLSSADFSAALFTLREFNDRRAVCEDGQ